jgi:hypothetical protein
VVGFENRIILRSQGNHVKQISDFKDLLEIAHAAKEFVQEDDITVVTLSFAAAPSFV